MDTLRVAPPAPTLADLAESPLPLRLFDADLPAPRFRLRSPPRRVVFAAVIGVAMLVLVGLEARTSWAQSHVLGRLAASSRWDLTSEATRDAAAPLRAPGGPYDLRLGHARIPDFLGRLDERRFSVRSRAVPSPALTRMVELGLHPIYHEKTIAGLEILGEDGGAVFRARYPDNQFGSFGEIPPLVVQSLVWIENRELLGPAAPTSNPAIEWRRLSGAVAGRALRSTSMAPRATGGGSTLATQLEKFRHSPGGVTASAGDKLRQIVSASARAYVDGRTTEEARRRIVTDYVNSVPLAAIEGYGEVNGLGNGLWAWYGMDFEEAVTQLELCAPDRSSEQVREQARAFRAVLSLFVAQRRPTYYLTQPVGRNELEELVDAHLRLLARDDIVPQDLRDATLAARGELVLRARAPERPPIDFVHRKAANALRGELLGLLDIERLYELDRLDLTVESTVSAGTQQAVSEELARLHDPAHVRTVGLRGPRLLEEADPSLVYYSLLLLERTDRGNLIRVQADNFPGPFDINRASKLELGSTAKLRTLVTYLEVVAALHDELSVLEPAARDSLIAVHDDPLTLWVRDDLTRRPDATMSEILSAAMSRTYSADPSETFFTGGGRHRFSNFDDTYDARRVTVEEAFRQSINLPFVRIMRDIVRYHTLRIPGSSGRLLEELEHPLRAEYLQRFADREGRTFIGRFHRKYAAVDSDRLLATFLDGRRESVQRLAWAYRSVLPVGTADELRAVLSELEPASTFSEPAVENALRRADPAAHGLPDLGYLAAVHPLEIQVVRHLLEHPGASLTEVMDASGEARQQVYRWLFRSSTASQDVRIRTMLEVEAFLEIGRSWHRLGYPFANVVPSLGTAIGSSGDRPLALAELMGILVAEGVRRPVVSIEGLRFAAHTPFDVELGLDVASGEQVLRPEVARTAISALVDVVENGTGRRARGAVVDGEGNPLRVGGKTGTGDNRRYSYTSGGATVGSTVVSRTAAFVFLVDDRFFGVLTAFVSGAEAERYRFTSALPVQVFQQLAPMLNPR